jgi:hypothetical protein
MTTNTTINDEFRQHCEKQFELLHQKLDRLDEAIRGSPGNGHPGIKVRLDRLEQDAKRQSRLIWLIIGAIVTSITSGLVAWITGS